MTALFILPSDLTNDAVMQCVPCGHCMQAMESDASLSRNTAIITVDKPQTRAIKHTANDAPVVFSVRPLSDYLPYKDRPLTSRLAGVENGQALAQAFAHMPINVSTRAYRLLADWLLPRNTAEKLAQTALVAAGDAYQEAGQLQYSDKRGRRLGAAAAFIDAKKAPDITTGYSFYPVSRVWSWPDLQAVQAGLKHHKAEAPLLLAYYGNTRAVNHVPLSGLLQQRGGKDYLIGRVDAEGLHLETALDFEPIPYLKIQVITAMTGGDIA